MQKCPPPFQGLPLGGKAPLYLLFFFPRPVLIVKGRIPGKTGASDDPTVRYNDNDDWPTHAPVGMYFQYGLVDEFMREWLLRQQELHSGEITRDEYFEWKLNWPETCDDSKKFDYYIQWRKTE